VASTPGASGAGAPEGRERDDAGAGLLRSAVRRDLVDTLANLPSTQRDGLTAQELSGRVGLHVTTVRFHLEQLVDAGLLASHSVRSPGAGRPSKKYLVAPGSLDAPPREESLTRLAELLAQSFTGRTPDGDALTPEQAGAAWAHAHAADLIGQVATTDPATTAGAWLSKVGAMVDVLRSWGYTPAVRTQDDGRTADVDIVRCPFLDLARDRPEVVCGVHRGLMRGTLEVLGEQDAEFSLTPFVEPTRCTAHVTTRTPFAPAGGTS